MENERIISKKYQEQKKKNPNKTKKIFIYLMSAMFAIIISKWIILEFVPASSNGISIDTNTSTKEISKQEPIPKDITITVDFLPLQEKIEKEYEIVRKDIDRYVGEELEKQKQRSYYELSKEDGFLDWIFGYFTGYKMMWKKIKGVFGSDDNEVKMVSDKFQQDVMQPNLHTSLAMIQSYINNRIDDYYKNVILMTSQYMNDKIKKLKAEGYSDIRLDENTIPWSKYIVTGSSDGFILAELAGVTSVSAVAGKFVGAKVATFLGPKMIGLLSAKTASVVASKIAASFSLIFAPIVDYAVNEGTKLVKYKDTKKMFEGMVSDILNENKTDILNKSHNILVEVKNVIYEELNKKAKIQGVKYI